MINSELFQNASPEEISEDQLITIASSADKILSARNGTEADKIAYIIDSAKRYGSEVDWDKAKWALSQLNQSHPQPIMKGWKDDNGPDFVEHARNILRNRLGEDNE